MPIDELLTKLHIYGLLSSVEVLTERDQHFFLKTWNRVKQEGVSTYVGARLHDQDVLFPAQLEKMDSVRAAVAQPRVNGDEESIFPEAQPARPVKGTLSHV